MVWTMESKVGIAGSGRGRARRYHLVAFPPWLDDDEIVSSRSWGYKTAEEARHKVPVGPNSSR